MTEILIIRIIILIRTVTISILIIIERIRTRIIKNINRNHNTKIIIRSAVIWTAFHPEKVTDLFSFAIILAHTFTQLFWKNYCLQSGWYSVWACSLEKQVSANWKNCRNLTKHREFSPYFWKHFQKDEICNKLKKNIQNLIARRVSRSPIYKVRNCY